MCGPKQIGNFQSAFTGVWPRVDPSSTIFWKAALTPCVLTQQLGQFLSDLTSKVPTVGPRCNIWKATAESSTHICWRRQQAPRGYSVQEKEK
jgi:hypothetical protein